MNIWIVNDILTGIPGTKTFWHMLLEIPGAIDKTTGQYTGLADRIEADNSPCDVLIRNATYFRKVNKNVPQIVLVQDRFETCPIQREVCETADHVVFNSKYTADIYFTHKVKASSIIPLGVNEEVFQPSYIDRRRALFGNNNPVGIFVGDYNETKGTAIFQQVVCKLPNINFIYISKQGAQINRSNVKNFPGGVDEHGMASLYNSSDFCIMCSPVETLHLTSVEAALCDKPIVGTKTGWLASHFNDSLGKLVEDQANIDEYVAAIEQVVYKGNYTPRASILQTPYVWSTCKASWEKLITSVVAQGK